MSAAPARNPAPGAPPAALLAVHLLLLLPLAIPLGTLGEKPIDLVYSDLLLPPALVYLLFLAARGVVIERPHFRLMGLSLMAALYFTVNALFGALRYEDEAVRLLSAFRFVKPFLFVFCAYACFRLWRPTAAQIVHRGAQVALLMALVLLGSDVLFEPGFPTGRWGGNFLGSGVYGFPNSPAVFYSVYLFFFLAALALGRSYLYLAGLLAVATQVFFSFSRAGWLTALILLLLGGWFSFRLSRRVALAYALAGTAAVVAVAVKYAAIVEIVSPWMYKLDTLTGRHISLAGRDELWQLALTLIAQRPLFGYGFEPFSHYSAGFDTPHQQYLEVMYKAGVLGLILFLAFYLRLLRGILVAGRQAAAPAARALGPLLLALALAVFASNFSQPSIGYPVLGNALVFYLSLVYFVLTARGTAAAPASPG